MSRNQQKIPAGGIVVLLFATINAVVMERALVSHPRWYQLLGVTLPLLAISLFINRKKLS